MRELIEKKVHWARRIVLDMCVSAKSGHLTSAYSCAEIVSVLYYAVMRIDPKKSHWEERDRFIMSKNHATVMVYPYLADLGYFPIDELMTFNADGSRLGGHSKNTLEGIDFSGGSLGIGFGVGAGLAYAAKMDNKSWYTFVLVGDGEAYEGSIWETAMFAGHNKLKNLVVILDRNGMCCTDFTSKLLNQEPFAEKWQAFGWDVVETDGHDVEKLLTVFKNIRERESCKPLCIIANTVKGKGIEFISNQPLWHGRVPTGSDIEKSLEELERGFEI